MYETKLMEHFSGVPVFSLADAAQIISNRAYAKRFLRRMVSEGRIRKIMRDSYTMSDDTMLVSTFLVKPSYVSSVSALSFHRLITQIPNEVFCFTTKRERTVKFTSEIRFLQTRHFFGFDLEKYAGSSIPVATPEKAIIDSMGLFPVSVFEEAFEGVSRKVIIEYLLKTGKSSTAKRIGYLAERNGIDVYDELESMLNGKYVFLDPLARKIGEKDKKWRLVVNG